MGSCINFKGNGTILTGSVPPKQSKMLASAVKKEKLFLRIASTSLTKDNFQATTTSKATFVKHLTTNYISFGRSKGLENLTK